MGARTASPIHLIGSGHPRPPGAAEGIHKHADPAIGLAELATLRGLVDDGVSFTEAARTLQIGRSTADEALANAEG